MIPHAERAVIDPLKVRGYLLSESHPVGRFRASFFATLGFTSDRWTEFDSALRDQHLSRGYAEVRSDTYGRFYTILAMLMGPSSTSSLVVSIWCIRTGEELPRLMTAYPGRTK